MRREGRLTLENGTLAGADLDLVTAVRVLVEEVGIRLEDALSVATSTPAALIKMNAALVPGETRARDVIRIAKDLSGAVPLVA